MINRLPKEGPRYVIPPQVGDMFEQMQLAFHNGDVLLCMMERADTGELVPVICLINEQFPNEWDVVPVAEISTVPGIHKHHYYKVQTE